MTKKSKADPILVKNSRANVTVEAILRGHGSRYPLMQPTDAVKLLYQAAFGPGHMISDYGHALSRVQREIDSICDSHVIHDKHTQFEDIGGGYARMYLRPNSSDEADARLVTLMFVASANSSCSDEITSETRKSSFIESLNALKKLTAEGVFSFDCDELNRYLDVYIESGMPAVSHSENYKNAYFPSYRVINREYSALYPLIREIFLTLEENSGTDKSVCMFIDGMCGSGKTTLAKLLRELFDARIIHMDDFFLPPEKRSPARLNEIGGNVDYERFRDEVIDHIDDASLSYGIFDCSIMRISSRAILPKKPLTIIEGSYACHPHFEIDSKIANKIKVYLECDRADQKQRILLRNGENMLKRFVGEWIPMENEYNNKFGIRAKSDFIIQT